MKVKSYSELRSNLAEILDTVEQGVDQIIITRSGHEPAILLQLDEYNSLVETTYLLSSPANAKHLMESIDDLAAGKGVIIDGIL